MEDKKKRRLSREDWLKAALDLSVAGVEKVKVAPLAAKLGVTTGSFYWHFKSRRELLDSLLKYWEHEKTDLAVERTREFEGSPLDRVYFLLNEIIGGNLPGYDLPIWAWAQWDSKAETVFTRVVRKRLSFVSSLFRDAGFTREQAEVRARLMVVYLMGEANLLPKSIAKREELVKVKYAVLTYPESRTSPA